MAHNRPRSQRLTARSIDQECQANNNDTLGFHPSYPLFARTSGGIETNCRVYERDFKPRFSRANMRYNRHSWQGHVRPSGASQVQPLNLFVVTGCASRDPS